MFWKTSATFFLGCSILLAINSAEELASSPSYLLLTGAKSERAGVTFAAPTGKFKVLAEDVFKRLQVENPELKPEAWMTSELDDKGKSRHGLVVIYPVTYDLRIENVSCDTCPNALFKFEGYESDQKWVNETLETWLRLNHGWNEELAHSMLKTVEIIQVRKDTRCVEFKYEEVKQYMAKVNGLNQKPPRRISN